MPTLKYGTQLPRPTRSAGTISVSLSNRSGAQGQSISIVDVDVPFLSLLKMAFKLAAAWFIVCICLLPVVLILWFVILAGIVSFFSAALSGHH